MEVMEWDMHWEVESREQCMRSYLYIYGVVLDEYLDLMNMDWQSTELGVFVQHTLEAVKMRFMCR